jgi:glycosyltransferase involved in cell wall biosynthesis
MKKKILMAESLGWNSLYRVGSHHYADHFMKHDYDVCWISNPISPFHRVSKSYRKYRSELKEKYYSWRNGGVRKDNLLYYAPMTLLPYANLPLLRSRWVIGNTLKLSFPRLKTYLNRNGFSSVDILWITNPVLNGISDIVKHRRLVTRVADDTGAFEDMPKSIRETERELLERANDVFVTSKILEHRFQWLGSKVHYLPNGVDYDHFRTADKSIPDEYNNIPSPRVIYVGAIAEWLDLEMLKKAASSMTDCSFVIIGEPRVDVSRIISLKNVYFLGGRAYETIPSFISHADVGIIPFKRSRLIESVNPIKLYEYMSCGLPVVASRWKAIEGIGSPALLADSHDDFIVLLKKALEIKDSEPYFRFARENSWDKRFDDVLRILEE